jgi:hypothetical protein
MRDRRRPFRFGPVGAALAVTVAVTTLAVTSPAETSRADVAAQDAPDLAAVACSLPARELERARNGWNLDRGPELLWFPQEPDFVGSGLPHAGPWDYIQHVPMLWYGPGHVAARGPVVREVTLADIAPTYAALTRFPFEAPDGRPMEEAVLPRSDGDPPKLIVTVVWDAVGRNVLDEHEGRWPFLASLISRGTWYEHAYVGSSPSATAQAHATIGTGAFPSHHGLVGHNLRIGGAITTPWQVGPSFWVLPTFADLYDRALGNEPVVGFVGTLEIHLGMMSHGALWSGGDRDIALSRTRGGGTFTLGAEGSVWNLRHHLLPFYELAGYANRVTGFARDKDDLDRSDGALDGRWHDNDIEQLLFGFDTPARAPYEERVIEEVLRRERFGRDGVTDLLFANFKVADFVSHTWSMNSVEMGDAVEWQDAALADLVGYLDRAVGRGEWVMVLTADHASMPDPAISGAFQISTGEAGRALDQRFDLDGDDRPVVELVQPAAVFVDEEELADNGATLDDLARYTMTLTKAEVAGKGVTPAPGTEDDVAFPWAFPSELLEDLRCA